MNDLVWFRRRSVGIGWHPAAWQGWLITAAAVAAAIGVLTLMRHSAARIPVVLVIFAVYAVVALCTGATPADER